VIDFREEDFVPILREAGGANVILDIVGGDNIARNFKAAALDGRIVQIAFAQGSNVQIDLMPVMLKRLSYRGSTLRSRSSDSKARIAADLRREIWPLIEAGRIRPVVNATFPLRDAAEAHRLMESATHLGKIVLLVEN
jgi:NADPH2:quinone reductase